MSILYNKIAAISQRELGQDLHMDGADEFTLLAHELDRTRLRIMKLIDANASINEERRVAEMAALRAQINSHFLFNALSSIKWLTYQENMALLRGAVDNLAIFLRYSLAHNEDQVALRDELGHLQAYVRLQRLRYGDEVNVYVDVDEVLLECKTVKLVLQPLVENAMRHGRREDGTGLNITLSSFIETDSYALVVEDDGNGISSQRIQDICAGKVDAPNSGYGLKNVINRVRLCTAGRGEVRMESVLGVCTKVTIMQPLVEKDAAHRSP